MFEMTGATVARVANDDPELGALLILDLLPALDPPIGGRLTITGLGSWGSGAYEASTDAAGLAGAGDARFATFHRLNQPARGGRDATQAA